VGPVRRSAGRGRHAAGVRAGRRRGARAHPAADRSALARSLPAARRLVSGYAGWRGSLGGEDAPQRLARSLKASGFRPMRTPQAWSPHSWAWCSPRLCVALRGGQRPAGRRRGLQAQGPVGEGLVAIDLPADVHAGTAKSALWCSPTPNTSRPKVSPVRRSRRCRSAAATARSGGRWRGRAAVTQRVRTPDQLLTLVPSARTSDRRSTALWPAPPRQPNRSRPRGRHLLRPARGSGG
jgi:hypothetical protein